MRSVGRFDKATLVIATFLNLLLRIMVHQKWYIKSIVMSPFVLNFAGGHFYECYILERARS